VRTLLAGSLLAIGIAAPAAAASRIDHEAECTYKKLTWDDFRGPALNVSSGVSWIMATIVVDPVRVEVTDKEGGGVIARPRHPNVYALMNKLESGAKPGNRVDRNLAHEQVHFDLTEYLARRLSRELRELTVEGPERSQPLEQELLQAVEGRYQQTVVELQHLQEQYDGETSHGQKSGAQKKWVEQAAKLLASEPPYELK
jgi:hypothetical protein